MTQAIAPSSRHTYPEVRGPGSQECLFATKKCESVDKSNLLSSSVENAGGSSDRIPKNRPKAVFSEPQRMQSKAEKIQEGLEDTVSQEAKEKIDRILNEINHLSDVEKLLLYLKLPTGGAGGQQKESTSTFQSSNRLEQIEALTWIKSHLEEDPEICLPKQEVYDDYKLYCETHVKKYLSQADFGKVMKCVFPGVKPRRLGQRGQSKHCYGGLKKKFNVKAPELPNVQIQALVKKEPHRVFDEEGNEVASASNTLVCEWAQKLLSQSFQGISELAEYLVSEMYVNSRSMAAFTVLANMQKSGKKTTLVTKTTPSSTPSSTPVTTSNTNSSISSSINTSSSNSTSSNTNSSSSTLPSINRHRETQLQLQRKLHERELIKEQKRKLEQQRTEIRVVSSPIDAATTNGGATNSMNREQNDSNDSIKHAQFMKSMPKSQPGQTPTTPQKFILPKSPANTSTVNSTSQASSVNTSVATTLAPAPPGQQVLLVPSQLGQPGTVLPQQVLILSPIHTQQQRLLQQTTTVSPHNQHNLVAAQQIVVAVPPNKHPQNIPGTQQMKLTQIPIASVAGKQDSALHGILSTGLTPTRSTPSAVSTVERMIPQASAAMTVVHSTGHGPQTVGKPITSAFIPVTSLPDPKAPVLVQAGQTELHKQLVRAPVGSGTARNLNKVFTMQGFEDIPQFTKVSKASTVVVSSASPPRCSPVITTPTNFGISGVMSPPAPVDNLDASRANLCCKTAPVKPKISSKTVSSLLKEQRGYGPQCDNKVPYVNDRRPVAELLRESREKTVFSQNSNSPPDLTLSPTTVTIQPITTNKPVLSVAQDKLTSITRTTPSTTGISKNQRGQEKVVFTMAGNFNQLKSDNIVPGGGGRNVLKAHVPGSETLFHTIQTDPTKKHLHLTADAIYKMCPKHLIPYESDSPEEVKEENFSMYNVVKTNGNKKRPMSAHEQVVPIKRSKSSLESITPTSFSDVDFNKGNLFSVESKDMFLCRNSPEFKTEPKASVTTYPRRMNNDMNVSYLEKDALLDYATSDPAPDLADITPSITNIVNSQDVETITERPGSCRDPLIGGTGLDEDDIQVSKNSSPHLNMYEDHDVSLGSRPDSSIHEELEVQTIRSGRSSVVSDGFMSPHTVQRMGQSQVHTPAKAQMWSNIAHQRASPYMNVQTYPPTPPSNRQRPLSSMGPGSVGSYHSLDQSPAYRNESTPSPTLPAATPGFGNRPPSVILQGGVYNACPSPAQFTMANQSGMSLIGGNRSASSTPVSMLSPGQGDLQVIAASPVEMSNSFMPIQSTIGERQSMVSPVRPIATVASNIQPSNVHTQSTGQHSVINANVEGGSFLPYGQQGQRFDRSPPSYQMAVQLMKAQENLTAGNSGGQFVSASSIKPVKRGQKGAKGGKRQRHNSAQGAVGRQTTTTTKRGQVGAQTLSALRQQLSMPPRSSTQGLVIQQGTDVNIINTNRSSAESPFSPEILDIMGSNNISQQSMNSLFRSHSVPVQDLSRDSDLQELLEGGGSYLINIQDSTDFPDESPYDANSFLNDIIDEKCNTQQASNQQQVQFVNLPDMSNNNTEKLKFILESGQVNRQVIAKQQNATSQGNQIAITTRPQSASLTLNALAMNHGNQGLLQRSVSYPNTHHVSQTPPPSLNHTPDYSAEIQRLMGQQISHGESTSTGRPATTGLIVSSGMSFLDTPTSIDTHDSAESLSDPMLSSICDSRDLAQDLLSPQQHIGSDFMALYST